MQLDAFLLLSIILVNSESFKFQHKFYAALTEDDKDDEIAKGFLEAAKSAEHNPTLYR